MTVSVLSIVTTVFTISLSISAETLAIPLTVPTYKVEFPVPLTVNTGLFIVPSVVVKYASIPSGT